jgi:hypothetical protein
MATENTNPRRMDNRTIDARSRSIAQQIEEAERKGEKKKVEALRKYGKSLSEQLKDAQRRGDVPAIKDLNTKSGIISASVGTVTGLVDLAVAGYNWGTGSTVKDLRTSVLDATGVPTGGTEGYEFDYNLPEYGLMAAGLASLAKSGWKGVKNIRESRKLDKFAKTLPPQQANTFRKFMMNGQGSDDPVIMSILSQLKSDPNYAEFFHKLDTAATKELLKNVAPKAGPMSPDMATRAAVTSVANKVASVKEARDTAGNVAFQKAFALAGDKPLVKTDETLRVLNDLQKQALTTDTPSSRALASSIESLKQTFLQTTSQPAVGAPITAAKTMTVPQFKNLMTEFGKKIGTEDALIKGLSSTDLDKLNKAVFAGLATDLKTAVATAASVDDRKALGALVQARTQFKDNSDAYNRLIAQGIPKFLQNKSVDEIDPEALLAEYGKLNPGQRTLFRSFVGEQYPEALQSIDSQVFDRFVEKAYTRLPDGTMGIDMGKLAKNWAELTGKQTTKSTDADMLAQALGTNFADLDKRMKDALVFSRKMDVAGVAAEGQSSGLLDSLQRSLPAVVGSTGAGYQGAKGTDLALKSAQALTSSSALTPDQLMKVLLTPEGAQYLKQAALSPNSTKTLERLTAVNQASTPKQRWAATSAVFTGASPRESIPVEEADFVIPEDMVIPEGLIPTSQEAEGAATEVEDFVIPDELQPMLQEAPAQPMMSTPVSQAAPASVMPVSDTPAQVSPEEEQAVRQVLVGMQQQDPTLNVDYVFNSYLRAAPEKRQQFMQLFNQK